MLVLNGQNKSLHEIGFIYKLSSGLVKCVPSELSVGSFVYIQDRKKILNTYHSFPHLYLSNNPKDFSEGLNENVLQIC